MAEAGQLLIENATIMFRNFEGRARQYNDEGKRNFIVFLDEDLAKTLTQDGWNVKRLKPRDDEPDALGQAILKVNVNFKGRTPPLLAMITSRGRVNVPEDLAVVFDQVDIKKVDVIINPWRHEMNGGGISAYLKSMFLTVQEDYLELKYSDVEYAEGLPAGADPLELNAGQDPDVIEGEVVYDSEDEN